VRHSGYEEIADWPTRNEGLRVARWACVSWKFRFSGGGGGKLKLKLLSTWDLRVKANTWILEHVPRVPDLQTSPPLSSLSPSHPIRETQHQHHYSSRAPDRDYKDVEPTLALGIARSSLGHRTTSWCTPLPHPRSPPRPASLQAFPDLPQQRNGWGVQAVSQHLPQRRRHLHLRWTAGRRVPRSPWRHHERWALRACSTSRRLVWCCRWLLGAIETRIYTARGGIHVPYLCHWPTTLTAGWQRAALAVSHSRVWWTKSLTASQYHRNTLASLIGVVRWTGRIRDWHQA